MTNNPSSRVHFWTLRDISTVDGWDPDVRPDRFADGSGHALIELFVRLRNAGLDVSIGPVIPKHSRCVVVFLGDIADWRSLRMRPGPLRRLARGIGHDQSVALVRSDFPLQVRPPRFVSCEVMPNASSITASRQRWVPLLPQRGIIRRSAERGERVESVVLKCFPENVPSDIDNESFRRRIASLGMSLSVDTQPLDWPNFETADVALCVRSETGHEFEDEQLSRRPATKLINAWVAGCIPIVSPERSYKDLARPGVDSLLARSGDEIIDCLSAVATDKALVRHLLDGVAVRSKEFEVDRTLRSWIDLLWSPLAPVSRSDVMATRIATATRLVVRRSVCRRP